MRQVLRFLGSLYRSVARCWSGIVMWLPASSFRNKAKEARIVAIRAESMFKLYSDAISSIDAAILPPPSPIQKALRAIQERWLVAVRMLPRSLTETIETYALRTSSYFIYSGLVMEPCRSLTPQVSILRAYFRCRLRPFLESPGLSRPGA